ncbi:hypothetical protein BEL04_16505 [Mucilaginibacter sp. PPCGB 2223]|nr:hypothetical protein BEL04_16505 [Mucilaginibacter sp. PPCGB 2223]
MGLFPNRVEKLFFIVYCITTILFGLYGTLGLWGGFGASSVMYDKYGGIYRSDLGPMQILMIFGILILFGLVVFIPMFRQKPFWNADGTRRNYERKPRKKQKYNEP